MAINYTKVGWDTSKYINPTNMNQMDDGIKAACDGVDEISANYIKASNSSVQTIENTATSTTNALRVKSNYSGSFKQALILFQDGVYDLGAIGIKDDKAVFFDTNSNQHEIALKDDITPTSYQYIGASGHETSVEIARVGKICFLVFNGAFWGFTIPSGFLPVTNAPQRNILIAGIGSERWMAHIEGTSPYSIYLHKNGGEILIPTDGTYNVYGTATYICQ